MGGLSEGGERGFDCEDGAWSVLLLRRGLRDRVAGGPLGGAVIRPAAAVASRGMTRFSSGVAVRAADAARFAAARFSWRVTGRRYLGATEGHRVAAITILAGNTSIGCISRDGRG
jgi:hypothetical protein